VCSAHFGFAKDVNRQHPRYRRDNEYRENNAQQKVFVQLSLCFLVSGFMRIGHLISPWMTAVIIRLLADDGLVDSAPSGPYLTILGGHHAH
jgi:hypothetical protein